MAVREGNREVAEVLARDCASGREPSLQIKHLDTVDRLEIEAYLQGAMYGRALVLDDCADAVADASIAATDARDAARRRGEWVWMLGVLALLGWALLFVAVSTQQRHNLNDHAAAELCP